MARKNFLFDAAEDIGSSIANEEPECKYATAVIQAFDDKDDFKIYYGKPEEFVPYENEKLRLEIHSGEEYDRLKESIEQNGIMQPVICTEIDGKKMIISGHNRVHIAEELGIEVPYIIKKDLKKEQMDLICIDTNLLNRQLQDFKPSQLAYLLKNKLEAEKENIKSNGWTNEKKKDAADNESNRWTQNRTANLVKKEYGLSKSQIYNYISLNKLAENVLQMVDDGKLTFRLGVLLAGVNKNVQQLIIECGENKKITEKIIKNVKDIIKEKNVEDPQEIKAIVDSQFNETEKKEKKMNMTTFKSYFPKDIKKESDRVNYIINALKFYNEHNKIE